MQIYVRLCACACVILCGGGECIRFCKSRIGRLIDWSRHSFKYLIENHNGLVVRFLPGCFSWFRKSSLLFLRRHKFPKYVNNGGVWRPTISSSVRCDVGVCCYLILVVKINGEGIWNCTINQIKIIFKKDNRKIIITQRSILFFSPLPSRRCNCSSSSISSLPKLYSSFTITTSIVIINFIYNTDIQTDNWKSQSVKEIDDLVWENINSPHLRHWAIGFSISWIY